ncbi:cytochrome P450 [Paenibacillus xylanexedens]|uniref:cytochrome P450 n=1 Tax=Paenibacillus xylanexedens TaxID=528191 RepID=UPI003CFC5752
MESTINSKRTMYTIENMTKDRYGLYAKGLEENNPVWSDELRAWLIFEYDLVNTYLKDSRFSANRKKNFIDQLDITDKQKDELFSFYSRWLMYMDGPEHRETRKSIQKPINNLNMVSKDVAKNAAIKVINALVEEEVDIINCCEDIAIPFTNEVLSQNLGLNIEDYQNILYEATNAVSFLWNPSPTQLEVEETIASIEKTYSIISEIVTAKRFYEGKLLDNIIKSVGLNKDGLSLIVNVAIDGHEPFLSTVKSFLYYYVECFSQHANVLTSVPIEGLVNEVLRLEAPFPYCARVAVEDLKIGGCEIKSGSRVIFLISAANRDPKHHQTANCPHYDTSKTSLLTFGAGAHYCPGAALTKKSIEEFAIQFISAYEEKKLGILEQSWNDTFGFRTLDKLSVQVKGER